MLKIRCKKHKDYKGVLPPRVQCLACGFVHMTRSIINQSPNEDLQFKRGKRWQNKNAEPGR